MESRGDSGQRQPRKAGVELMDGSAERVTGDVERHGHQGHGGDDALDMEAQGLISGNGDAHGVVGNQFPMASITRLLSWDGGKGVAAQLQSAAGGPAAR